MQMSRCTRSVYTVYIATHRRLHPSQEVPRLPSPFRPSLSLPSHQNFLGISLPLCPLHGAQGRAGPQPAGFSLPPAAAGTMVQRLSGEGCQSGLLGGVAGRTCPGSEGVRGTG